MTFRPQKVQMFLGWRKSCCQRQLVWVGRRCSGLARCIAAPSSTEHFLSQPLLRNQRKLVMHISDLAENIWSLLLVHSNPYLTEGVGYEMKVLHHRKYSRWTVKHSWRSWNLVKCALRNVWLIFKVFPKLVLPTVNVWYQYCYKDRTDETRLFRQISMLEL